MKAITYRLRLLEPVLVSQAESGEENSAIGLSFIPGSAIRGALATRYLQAFPSPDPAADTIFRRLFLDSSVCYLNAYPWREGARALPRPLSWMTEKDETSGESGAAFDWAVDPDQELERPKSVDGQFCVVVDDTAYMISPERQVNVHISLQNVNERSGRDGNTVYRYEALAAGEVLAAAIVSNDDDLLDRAKALLDGGEIALGTAHRAGYGLVKIEDVKTSQDDWIEYGSGSGSSDDAIVVTLLSDVIVRGRNGQIDGDIGGALSALLQTSELKPVRSYHSLRLAGGYNRKWNLPLPQTWAIQMGSTFVFPAGSFRAEDVRRLTQLGIGERRSEGFGRLAINWQSYAELRWEQAGAPDLAKLELTETSTALARQMANRRLRLLLDRQLAAAVNGVRLTNPPKNSQLSRVRNAAQQALVAGDFAAMSKHLANLKGAREQFEKARIGRTPMDRWIEERVSKLDVEIQLQLGQPPALPEVAGQKAQLTQELRIEYAARLIDGVMKRAAKLNQKKEEGS
jgi:CRISPR-associated protein Csx10